eukprot:COSAG06_NODE_27038_length_602_cov_1.844930_1_plen_158_part_10
MGRPGAPASQRGLGASQRLPKPDYIMPASQSRRKHKVRSSQEQEQEQQEQQQQEQQQQEQQQQQQQQQQRQRPGQRRRRRPVTRSPSAAAAGKEVTALWPAFELWVRFGRHSSYGNGLRRPLMRGWLHTAVLVLGLTVIRAACTRTCVSVADCEPHFL